MKFNLENGLLSGLVRLDLEKRTGLARLDLDRGPLPSVWVIGRDSELFAPKPEKKKIEK